MTELLVCDAKVTVIHRPQVSDRSDYPDWIMTVQLECSHVCSHVWNGFLYANVGVYLNTPKARGFG